MTKHKHQAAVDLIRKEVARICGELFEESLIQMGLESNASYGDEEAKKTLNMMDFVRNLSLDADNAREARLIELMGSIKVLAQNEK